MAKKHAVVKSVLRAGAPVIAMRKSKTRKSSDSGLRESEVASKELSLEDVVPQETLRKLFAPAPSAPRPREFDQPIQIAHRLELLAFNHAEEAMGLEILSITRAFLGVVVRMLMIRRAFEISPRRSIDGPGGVAEILDLSRTTVLHEVKKLGLATDDFRDPRLGLRDLMGRSKPILGLIARLEGLDSKFRAVMLDEGILTDSITFSEAAEDTSAVAEQQRPLPAGT